MKTKKKELCYFCSKPATTREHLPPRQIFKGFECDSITVPSCDEHNTEKGKNDQAIVSALLIPLDAGRAQYPLEPDVVEAIEHAKPSFERSKRLAVRSPFLADPPPGLEDLPDLAHLDPTVELAKWVRQLTAGIIREKLGESSQTIAWSKATSWSPDWYPTAGPGPIAYADARVKAEVRENQVALLNQLPWKVGWSASPRPYPATIYRFDIHVFANKVVMVRHVFYGKYAWYVGFKASKRIIAALVKHL